MKKGITIDLNIINSQDSKDLAANLLKGLLEIREVASLHAFNKDIVETIDQLLIDNNRNISIFKEITEATLLIEKDITENKRYGYDIVTSLLDGVEKIFPDIPKRNENIITMRICDNLERRGISFSF
jgi:hypothetical protein|tara:strand:+ start:1715 stop:2095 length:381 start_codon:yes stop_codon:yes gene_type:complete